MYCGMRSVVQCSGMCCSVCLHIVCLYSVVLFVVLYMNSGSCIV
jgi:hypothetical protein